MKQGGIFVISGPSGTGKNTVYDELRKVCPDIVQTVSATTRKPRENEVDGVDYYFIERDDFLEKVENGEFIEFVCYGGNYYGTLKSEIQRLVEAEKTVVLVIEVNGALNFKAAFPDCVTVFLLPPSFEELERRILLRGQNTPEEVSARLSIAREEMTYQDKYDYRVVNDDLDDCVDYIYKNIIKKERSL